MWRNYNVSHLVDDFLLQIFALMLTPVENMLSNLLCQESSSHVGSIKVCVSEAVAIQPRIYVCLWIILEEVLSYPRILGLVIHSSFPVLLWSILRMFGKRHRSKELNNSSTKYSILPGHVKWVCRIHVCLTTGFIQEAESRSLRSWATWAWNDKYTLDISPPKDCYPSLIKIYSKSPSPSDN